MIVARTVRRLVVVVVGLAAVGAIGWALWPAPVAAELATVERGPMRVTVDEDGRTRIKERYVVSAPLAGRLARVALQEGDAVIAGQTILAAIDPSDPALLDPRSLAEGEARVKAAEAALDRAGAALARADAANELAQSELKRVREAQDRGAAVAHELEEKAAEAVIRAEERRAAEFAREIARFELEQARAAVMHTAPGEDSAGWRFEIAAPVSGRVLRVIQESAGVVQAGSPLIEVGDPADLELVVDVLSSDAVPIRPGAPAILEQWGGDHPLQGRVRLVEPAAFTKISALGVEEQRVNVVIDFADPPDARAGLGDGFRIEARIVVWEEPLVVKVPTGALFRDAESWGVFAVDGGRARARPVTVGRRNGAEAQIVSGMAEGETVVVYPSDRVRDGVRVAARER